MKQQAESYSTQRHVIPTNDAIDELLADMREWLPGYLARINGEEVACQIVDTDPADNRTYIKTHEQSMTFCVPMDAVTVAQ